METDKLTPVLSILLPTVTNRAELFSILKTEVDRQASGKPVEVVVACDSKEISIGRKRQNLLEASSGRYVVFVDDDDMIAPDYIDRILTALSTSPDCVGFLITCTTNGKNPVKAIASMRYKEWAENRDGYAHVRTIYHKTPVRREIALAVGFPDLRYAEDKPFAKGVTERVKTEVFIPHVMYYYRFRAENFNAKYGIKPGPVTREPRQRPSARRFDRRGRRVG